MNKSPESPIFTGVVALIILLSSQSGGAQLAPKDPGAKINAAGQENRRDARRLLLPLHERPERPMLADTSSDSGDLARYIELRIG